MKTSYLTPVLFAALLVALGFPAPVGAQAGAVNIGVLTPYAANILFLINGIFVPVIFAIAFITFIWGVYRYFFLGADSEAERAKGKEFVLWGIIGFVVILSVWSLVALVGGTFGLSAGGQAPSYPKL